MNLFATFIRKLQTVILGLTVCLPVHSAISYDLSKHSNCCLNLLKIDREVAYSAVQPGLSTRQRHAHAKSIQGNGLRPHIVVAQADPASDDAAKHIGDEVGAYLRREGYIESGKYHDEEGYRKTASELVEDNGSSDKENSDETSKKTEE